MKKMIRTTSAILATGMLLTGCKFGWGSERPDGRVTSDPDADTVVSVPDADDKTGERTGMDIAGIGNATYDQDTEEAYLDFAISLYSQCASSSDENTMISPASVLFALGMTSAGAGGNTLDQMVDTMAPGQDAYSLQAFAGDYNRRLNEAADITLQSANSIWLNELNNVSVYGDFLDYVTDTYDAQVSSVAFDPDGIATMNGWVDDATNGMIDQIVPADLDPTAVMILINAVAFDAEWSDGFSEDMIHNGIFHNSDGTTSDVTMLHENEGSIYLETGLATGFARYYGEDNDYYFVAMLPEDESVSANEFASSLTADDFREFIDSMTTEYNVIYELPEFESDYNILMNDVLTDMGIEDAFMSDGTADFSNMSNFELYINNVIHKTHIEVNREGTSAAAATAVEMDLRCVAPSDSDDRYVILDRPFAYAIVEASTGLPLFIGTVNTL